MIGYGVGRMVRVVSTEILLARTHKRSVNGSVRSATALKIGAAGTKDIRWEKHDFPHHI